MSLTSPRNHAGFQVLVLLLVHCVKSFLAINVEDPNLIGGTVTCKNMCGQVEVLPCSCEARCVVWRNCCENMASDCPQIWAEGRARFAHLLQSEVHCGRLEYHMITSCPTSTSSQPESTRSSFGGGDATMSSTSPSPSMPLLHPAEDVVQDNRLPREETKELTTETSFTTPISERQVEVVSRGEEVTHASRALLQETSGEDDSGPAGSLMEIINAAPVTDTITGITYVNSEVFSCNGGKLSHYARWEALFRLLDLDSLQFTEMLLFQDYIPPSTLNASFLGPRCYPLAIATCESSILERHPHLAHQCKSFTSYVTPVEGLPVFEIYRNRYCFQCKYEDVYNYRPHIYRSKKSMLRGRLPFIRVSASQAKENNVDKIFSAIVDSDPFNISPWREAACKISTTKQEEDNNEERFEQHDEGEKQQQQQQTQPQPPPQQQLNQTECTVKSCSPNFEYRPDGFCKKLFSCSIAFPNFEFFFSPTETVYLSRFVRCSFQHILGIEVVDYKQSLQFDVNTRKLMHVVDLTTYIFRDNGIYFMDIDEESQYLPFKKLLAMAKTLKKHLEKKRKALVGEATSSPDLIFQIQTSKSAQPIPNITSVDLDDEFSELRYHLNVDRGNIVDNVTTTICLRPLDSVQDERIHCYVDQLFEEDLQLIEKFSGLSCLAVFSGSASFVRLWWYSLGMTLLASAVAKF